MVNLFLCIMENQQIFYISKKAEKDVIVAHRPWKICQLNLKQQTDLRSIELLIGHGTEFCF